MPAISPVVLRLSEDIMAKVLCVLYDDPGPRTGTAPEGKPSQLRWAEVTSPVLRPLGEVRYDGTVGLRVGARDAYLRYPLPA
jgi:hypothetical protein